MRQKRCYRIITFRTTTEAMAFEAKAACLGIPGRIIPIPREITAGCGLSWKLTPEEYEEAKEKIEAEGLAYEQVAQAMLLGS